MREIYAKLKKAWDKATYVPPWEPPRIWAKYEKLWNRNRGLTRASETMLRMYIKEIDVLTPAKLRAVRRVRSILGG